MRCCLEIAGRFSLLALVFLTVVLLAVGIGAVTGGDANETAELSRSQPAPASGSPGATNMPVGIQAQGGNKTSDRPGSTSPPPIVPTSLVWGSEGRNVRWASAVVRLLLAIAPLFLIPVAHHWGKRNKIKLLIGLR